MTKVKALLLDLEKASQKLREALQLPETEINRDAAIQRFEFTFELIWKLLQAILTDSGLETFGPKNVFREAGKAGLIHDVERWIAFLKARNLTSHTYNEKYAKKVYEEAKIFFIELEKTITIIKEYISKYN